MSKGQSLQDRFLNYVAKGRYGMTGSTYLVNGIKLRGVIDAFDQYVIMLKISVNQMIYKYDISTVVSLRKVNMSTVDDVGSGQ